MSGQKGIKLQIMLDGEQQLHHIGLVEYYLMIHSSELWIQITGVKIFFSTIVSNFYFRYHGNKILNLILFYLQSLLPSLIQDLQGSAGTRYLSNFPMTQMQPLDFDTL